MKSNNCKNDGDGGRGGGGGGLKSTTRLKTEDHHITADRPRSGQIIRRDLDYLYN